MRQYTHYDIAIIQTGAKQYKVKVGDKIKIEKILKPAEGGKVVFDQVLAKGDDKDMTVGAPTIAGATVEATYIREAKAKKVDVVHYKAKVRHKKISGHRQPFTEVLIDSIS